MTTSLPWRQKKGALRENSLADCVVVDDLGRLTRISLMRTSRHLYWSRSAPAFTCSTTSSDSHCTTRFRHQVLEILHLTPLPFLPLCCSSLQASLSLSQMPLNPRPECFFPIFYFSIFCVTYIIVWLLLGAYPFTNFSPSLDRIRLSHFPLPSDFRTRAFRDTGLTVTRWSHRELNVA